MPLITQISCGKENCKSKACEYSYHLLPVFSTDDKNLW